MLKHRGAALACSSTFDGSLPDRPVDLPFASPSFSSAIIPPFFFFFFFFSFFSFFFFFPFSLTMLL